MEHGCGKGTWWVSLQNGKFIQMHALRNVAVLPCEFKYIENHALLSNYYGIK